MNAKQNITIQLDYELLQAWEKIHVLRNISLPQFVKESLAKETLRYARYPVTKAVKEISGTLHTQLDYKSLREQMITERIQDYENLR